MINTVIFDLGSVLLFPKDTKYTGKLNHLHEELSRNPNYNFLDHFYLNTELLEYLETIKKDYEFYIITKGTIQNVPEIKGKLNVVFDKVFSTKEMTTKKRDFETYTTVASMLQKTPSEILFVDNNKENYDAAKKAGLVTILYKNNKQTIKEMEGLI